MLIWRMETKRGLGFYRVSCHDDYRYLNETYHPNAKDRSGNRIRCIDYPKHRFGFNSITQARNWFRWEHDTIIFNEKFYLVAYDRSKCKDIMLLNQQLMFIPPRKARKAKLKPSFLHTKDVTTLNQLALEAITIGNVS